MSESATSEAPSRPAPGDLAQRVALWSIVPLFPIGLVAALLGLFTLARGGNRRQGWTALIVGAGFGTLWFFVLLYNLVRLIQAP